MMAIGIFMFFFAGLFMGLYEGQSVALRVIAAVTWGGSVVVLAAEFFKLLWIYLP